MSRPELNILAEEDDDPMLSAINLVDVFLVLIVALLAAVSFNQQHSNQPGKVELTIEQEGQKIRYQGSGSLQQGDGVRAGVAYRLADGSIIYVPEGGAAK